MKDSRPEQELRSLFDVIFDDIGAAHLGIREPFHGGKNVRFLGGSAQQSVQEISRILGNFAIRSKNQVFSNLLVILRQGVVGLGTTAGALRQRVVVLGTTAGALRQRVVVLGTTAGALRQRVVVLGTTAGALRQRVVVVGTRFLWGFMFFDRFSIGKYISPPPLFLSWRTAKTLCFLPVQIAP